MSLRMYDDTNVDLIPPGALAVAGYVNGRWATWPLIVKKFPNAKKLSIAVTSHADADCLDVEPGDATNAVAPGWVKKQQGRGVKRPVVYTSVSNAQALLNALAAVGISREEVRLWTAHYTFREHICDKSCYPGFHSIADATQWTNHALSRSLDKSLVLDSFFGAPRPKGKIWPNPTKPTTIPGWWYVWAQWVMEGRSGVRPENAPRRIPIWAWVMLHNWQIRNR